MKNKEKFSKKIDAQQQPLQLNSASISIGYRIDEDMRTSKIQSVGVSLDGKSWTYTDIAR